VELGTHWKPLPALNNKILAIPRTYVRYKVEFKLPLLRKINQLYMRCKDILNDLQYFSLVAVQFLIET